MQPVSVCTLSVMPGGALASFELEWPVSQYNVMVTAGANQALTSLMLTLLDPPDRAVLFRPYYFNALMALQMTG